MTTTTIEPVEFGIKDYGPATGVPQDHRVRWTCIDHRTGVTVQVVMNTGATIPEMYQSIWAEFTTAYRQRVVDLQREAALAPRKATA